MVCLVHYCYVKKKNTREICLVCHFYNLYCAINDRERSFVCIYFILYTFYNDRVLFLAMIGNLVDINYLCIYWSTRAVWILLKWSSYGGLSLWTINSFMFSWLSWLMLYCLFIKSKWVTVCLETFIKQVKLMWFVHLEMGCEGLVDNGRINVIRTCFDMVGSD